MKKTIQILTLSIFAFGICTVTAEDEKKKKSKKAAASLADKAIKKYETAGLTEEQTGKIRELGTAAETKLKDAKAAAAMTDDQKKAQKAAMEAAKAAGKEKKELRDAVKAAVTLTEAQLAAQKQSKEIMGEFTKSVKALITEEQVAKMKAAAGEKKKKKEPAPADNS